MAKLLKRSNSKQFLANNYRIRSTLAAADSLVISGSEDGHVYVWDVMTGKVEHKLRHAQSLLAGGKENTAGSDTSKREVVSAVTWNQLKKQWATAGGDGTVVVWGKE